MGFFVTERIGRLIDYSNIVIHIFTNDTRERYKLEELWGDANIKRIK